jgi:uncharacterized protein YggL (DUF469 family)
LSKYLELSGVIQINDGSTIDEFFDKFIDFVELHGCYYGGSVKEFDPDLDEETGSRGA